MDAPRNIGAAAEPTAALKTLGLTKRYFNNCVVHEVSLTVARGEIYGLVGRNGAGKSTLMKMVCGLVLPTSGSVEILGQAMRLGEGHPRVGSLIERPGVFPGMTAFDNVMCRATVLGLANPREETRRALELVDLAGERGRASSFSQGMKQRLGLAIALVGTPDLLVLDEPFNGIDIEGTRELRATVRDLSERLGVTVLVSSHVIGQLARIVTRYGVMRRGALVCEQAAEEVERACIDCLCVRSPTPERALAVLQEAFPRAGFAMDRDGALLADRDVPTREVVRALVEADVEVTEASVRHGDLERYFADLMGGKASGGSSEGSRGGGCDA